MTSYTHEFSSVSLSSV